MKAKRMEMVLTPGTLVTLPGKPEWGVGQVQSTAGRTVTVNFEHGGKVTLNLERANLEVRTSAEDLAASKGGEDY